MIDMLMRDKNEDFPIRRKLIWQKLTPASQFPVLPAPVIKYEQKVPCFNRKTAMEKMCDLEL